MNSAGGAYHSVILGHSNTVWTFGAAQLGQLGRPVVGALTDGAGLPVDPIPRPVVGLPPGEIVRNIGAGFYNTLVACRSGRLFCSGENQNLQCGNKTKTNLHVFHEVVDPMLMREGGVVKAKGGYCHTLVLALTGKVFSLGCGDDGQRGDGRLSDDDDDGTTNRAVVTEINLPSGVLAADMAAGANHSVILGQDGHAYAFGSNEYGQCGAPMNESDENDNTVGFTNILWPRRVELPEGAGPVVEVSAGYAHTMLRDSKGIVYALGQNENGQLGLGVASAAEVDNVDTAVPVALPIK